MIDVIALTGYAGVGKDTVADILVRDHGYTKLAFADKVKELLLAVNPWIVVPELGGIVRLQAMINTMGWHKAKHNYPEVRRLLQELGTETRNVAYDDVWLGSIMDYITDEDSPEKIVISDLRFPNELDALRDVECGCCFDVTVVRLTREGIGPANDHETETVVLPHDIEMPLDSVTVDRMPSAVKGMLRIIGHLSKNGDEQTGLDKLSEVMMAEFNQARQ